MSERQERLRNVAALLAQYELPKDRQLEMVRIYFTKGGKRGESSRGRSVEDKKLAKRLRAWLRSAQGAHQKLVTMVGEEELCAANHALALKRVRYFISLLDNPVPDDLDPAFPELNRTDVLRTFADVISHMKYDGRRLRVTWEDVAFLLVVHSEGIEAATLARVEKQLRALHRDKSTALKSA